MRKIFSLIFVFLLVFSMAACEKARAGESGTIGNTEITPVADTVEGTQETMAVSDNKNGELAEEKPSIVKAEFDFERKTAMLNSGYEMPINGLGTYSLHGDECIGSVKSALSNGVRLIDTASAYGNDVICCDKESG